LSIHLDALIWADDVSAQQRRVVDAVLAAARDGDFERLVTVLDPDMGADGGALAGASRFVRGAQAVAE
jgi:RNA polymerase sigma-70 factor (ECF subfamily)